MTKRFEDGSDRKWEAYAAMWHNTQTGFYASRGLEHWRVGRMPLLLSIRSKVPLEKLCLGRKPGFT